MCVCVCVCVCGGGGVIPLGPPVPSTLVPCPHDTLRRSGNGVPTSTQSHMHTHGVLLLSFLSLLSNNTQSKPKHACTRTQVWVRITPQLMAALTASPYLPLATQPAAACYPNLAAPPGDPAAAQPPGEPLLPALAAQAAAQAAADQAAADQAAAEGEEGEGEGQEGEGQVARAARAMPAVGPDVWQTLVALSGPGAQSSRPMPLQVRGGGRAGGWGLGAGGGWGWGWVGWGWMAGLGMDGLAVGGWRSPWRCCPPLHEGDICASCLCTHAISSSAPLPACRLHHNPTRAFTRQPAWEPLPPFPNSALP